MRHAYRGVILMLTARDEDFDQILGLEMGADDYIAKPVQPRVLLAPDQGPAAPRPVGNRTFGLRRRGERCSDNSRISQATRTASLGDQNIDLTTAEFDLLWLLACHAGNVLSRDDLLQSWGIGFDGLDRSIDARISRLRKKLNDDPENPTRIKTGTRQGLSVQ